MPSLLGKILQPASKKGGKNLISVHYDNFSPVTPKDIRDRIKFEIEKKGFVLFEDVVAAKSGFETIGLLYADLIAYLFGRYDIHKNDLIFFKDLPPEKLQNDGRFKKLKTSKELLGILASLKSYSIK